MASGVLCRLANLLEPIGILLINSPIIRPRPAAIIEPSRAPRGASRRPPGGMAVGVALRRRAEAGIIRG